jgi:hypothetical protein
MDQYFFDLTIDDKVVRDEDGKSLPDKATAAYEARAAAGELMADALRHLHPTNASKLIVRDETGSELLTIDLDVTPLLQRLNGVLVKPSMLHRDNRSDAWSILDRKFHGGPL